jgi:DNA invertase Pin-like site-specific DNA recombinase
MYYGYTRETPGGESQTEKFKKQVEMLKKEGVDSLTVDNVPSGKKKKYDRFSKLLLKLQPGDTLVIPSIDRVSHSASDFEGLMRGLLNRGVAIRVLDLGTLDDSPKGKVRQEAVRAFAQFEKVMVVERTQTRKAEIRKGTNLLGLMPFTAK